MKQGSVFALAMVLACTLAAGLAHAAQVPPRVVSLDQCADQYVLALSPRSAIVALSPRARQPDSYMRQEALGLPLRRPDAEAVLAERPDVVVRSWGGGASLPAVLRRRGVRVAQIAEADDFDGVRANIRAVAGALGQPARGRALIARMDAELAAAKGAWRSESGLYLTSGGFTAGPGTLVDAVMRAAGMRDAATAPGYGEVPAERLILSPPKLLVLGFFEPRGLSLWAPGRGGAVQRLIAGRPTVRLQASVLACPAWFAADGALALAQTAPARSAPGRAPLRTP